jgi:alpha-beta hydrolase superfamily lysophospholipase
LESDLNAFVDKVKPAHPSTLIGFSSGGGFVLRIAASEMQSAFGSYLLLAPFWDTPRQTTYLIAADGFPWAYLASWL